jgi:hypothetical protein
MRVEPIPCSQATGYSSPTALAFVRSPEQFAEHFPSTAELLSSGSLSGSIPLSTSEREALARAIELSCAGIELSALQQQHLRELRSAEALAVVTGQQVGFLGGPAYTLFKALAAILWAQRFRSQQARPVVPVFWIEDNDSDGREAGLLHWWTPEGELRLLQADRPEALQTPYSVAVRSFPPTPDAPWRQALEYVCPQLPLDLAELLQQSISPERSWSQAFLALLQYRLGKHGILLLRASVAREQGLFVPILQRALEEEQQLHELLQRGIQRLQQQAIRHRFCQRRRCCISILRKGCAIGSAGFRTAPTPLGNSTTVQSSSERSSGNARQRFLPPPCCVHCARTECSRALPLLLDPPSLPTGGSSASSTRRSPYACQQCCPAPRSRWYHRRSSAYSSASSGARATCLSPGIRSRLPLYRTCHNSARANAAWRSFGRLSIAGNTTAHTLSAPLSHPCSAALQQRHSAF